MLDRLYGEADNFAERVDKRDVDAQYRADYATKKFEERVQARRDLSSDYFSFNLIQVLTSLCCCL